MHRYRGSVITFSGDAITCWLDGDDGLRATACALAMQETMGQFAEVETPSGFSVSLAMKAAVATGPVRRFLVGDPEIQVMDVPAEPGSHDLRLVAGVPEIDAGVALPNLNDAFALSGPPDMGAFEYGESLPECGLRAWLPDLSPSFKRASHLDPGFGETVTYTILLRNTGALLTDTLTLTDIVPAGLSYVTGSLTATLGAPDDGSAPLLHWSGVLSSTSAVTLTYAVTVAETSPRFISNTVTLNAGSAGLLSRTATIVVNSHAIYLPAAMR